MKAGEVVNTAVATAVRTDGGEVTSNESTETLPVDQPEDTVISEPVLPPGVPTSPSAPTKPSGGDTPRSPVLPNTGGPAAGILGLGLLAVIAGAVVLVRDRRRRDEETA